MTGALALLTACGGGGGGGSGATAGVGVVTTSSPTAGPGVITFPLQAAFKALTQAGSVDKFTVTGDCSGTAQTSNGATTSAAFQGINGFATAEYATLALSSCTTSITSSTGTYFFDTNFAPLGTTDSNGGYTVAVASALPLPATVKVGDASPIYRVFASYQDSTLTARTGQVVEGFAIEADTANTSGKSTAIYHVTSTVYDNANNLVSTKQSFYRVGVDGSMSLVSLDVKDNTFLALHLVYARIG